MAVSHKRAITKIADPIHGTLLHTSYETEIIDSRFFQRLMDVLQNSTTYVAYPSNRTTRFAHSLGVAKICGDLLQYSLNNADPSALKEFLEDVATFLDHQFFPDDQRLFFDEHRKTLIHGWESTIRGRSGFSHSPFLAGFEEVIEPSRKIFPEKVTEHQRAFEAQFLVDIIWQSLRVCGLLHDAGHLPMSHSFEQAIKVVDLVITDEHSEDLDRRSEVLRDFKSVFLRSKNLVDKGIDQNIVSNFSSQIKKYFSVDDETVSNFLKSIELHERRSLYIINEMARPNVEDSQSYNHLKSVIYTIAFLTFISSILDRSRIQEEGHTDRFNFRNRFFRVMKSMVAGEVDADRMDYTIRDGHSCGSSIGDFDLPRVVQNAMLVKHAKKGHPVLAFHERSLSGIERFFSERYDGYKYLIYHRTSARTEACLQELVGRLVHYAFVCPNSAISDALGEYGLVHINDGEVTDIYPITSASLENFSDATIKVCFFKIYRIISKWDDKANVGKNDDCDLAKIIEILLKIFLFRDFGNIYNPFKRINFKTFVKDALGDSYDKAEFLKVGELFQAERRRLLYAHFLRKMMRSRFGNRVFPIVQFNMPKIYKSAEVYWDEVSLVDRDANIYNVEQYSHYLKGMKDYKIRDTQINIYFLSPDIRWDTEIQTEVDAALKSALCELYHLALRQIGDKGDSKHVS